MEISSDPYEQKLYHMFKSYDTESIGSLDQTALLKLCNSLELNDKGNVLVRSLFTKCESRVTFKTFKEALLDFLGSEMQESKTNDGYVLCTPDSPGREVSPKLVMGAKKYGRRSRPQSLVSNSSESDSETENKAPSILDKKTQKVQRSSSQSEIQARKRRPNSGSKLKRCASLPAQKNSKIKETNLKPPELNLQQSQLASSVESLGNLDFENLSHSLYEIWTSYGNEVGTSFLDRSQLETVCDRVGLHKIAGKVADEVFEKLNLDIKEKISFIDFIGLIQGDTDGVTIPTDRNLKADTTSTIKGNNMCNLKDPTTENDLHADRDIPSQMEMIPANDIIEMWEAAGIVQAKKLLRNLGIDEEQVHLPHLSNALEEEISGLHNETQTLPLMKAFLILRKAEVVALHQAFRQLVEENKKLHTDNREANRRVALLAQEIDERHATLEDTTKSEIRMLEQRHAEIVRELTSQLATDRENWSSLNVRLERRIKNLEQEETKLKTDLQNLQDENSALETEQMSLQKQVTELLESNIKLNNEIMEMEDRQRNDESHKDQKETEEVLELIDKITSLQIENSSLRDKNDELAAEVESLSSELSKLKNKKCSNSRSNLEVASDTLSDDPEHSALGIKRRGDSPSKTRIPEESPRLGKLRKCSNENSESEASGDWVALNSELNAVNATPASSSGETGKNIEQQIDETNATRESASTLEKELCEQNMKKSQTTNLNSDVPLDYDSLKAAKIRLEARCQDLENSLEQMRKAYEDCEDYWQSKLSEERQLFEKERQIYEEEQQESDKKFTELMQKVREYEEQFNKEGRLSPIEEKDCLEQQYADLEAELEDIKENARKIFEEKTKEIEDLQLQIKELREKMGESVDVNSSSQLAADAVDLGSQASSPISYLWNQSTIQAPARDYQNPNWNVKSKPNNAIESSTTSEVEIMTTTGVVKEDTVENKATISPIQKPSKSSTESVKDTDETASVASAKSVESNTSTSSSRSINKSSGPESSCPSPNLVKEELKRLKMVEVQLKEQIKDLAHKRDGLVMELQQLHEAKPVLEKAYARATHPSLLQRVNQLEQKNRHLQSVLKQQQHYTESIMHQTWQQQRSEITELRSRIETQGMIMAEQAQRLANADVLVKDLYVENSHLSATIQRLEQQRSRANLIHQHQGVSGVPGLP